jgi:Mn2+/Fe2+ NRAMP family transporter
MFLHDTINRKIFKQNYAETYDRLDTENRSSSVHRFRLESFLGLWYNIESTHIPDYSFKLNTHKECTMPEKTAVNPESQPQTAEKEVVDPYERRPEYVREPPVGMWNTIKFLGPGLILVGSVVGSGEIILTTTLGATVGFVMLWWMLISCWGKSIVQAELARYTVSSGETVLPAFNRLPGKLPGPRKAVSWFIWLWLINHIPGLLGGGGIYGGVGQAVNMMMPFLGSEWWTILFAALAAVLILSGTYRFLEKLLTVMVVTFTFVTLACAVLLQFTPYAITWADVQAGLRFEFPAFAIAAALAAYGGTGVNAGESMAYTYWCVEKGYARFAGPTDDSDSWIRRARGWIRVMHTDVVLTLLVLTFATVPFYMLGAGVLNQKNLFSIESTFRTELNGGYSVSSDLRQEFRNSGVPLSVDAELSTEVENRRWQILNTDEAGDEHKYILRLNDGQLNVYKMPNGVETISILSDMYTETLGDWARWLFMFGAFFVLFSTVVSGLGGGSRMMADCMGVLGIIDPNDYKARVRILRIWAVGAPAIMSTCYFFVQNPVWMLTISGTVGAMMMPIVAGSTIYLRYTRTDRRIAPSGKADTVLWVCFLIMVGLALYIVYRIFA